MDLTVKIMGFFHHKLLFLPKHVDFKYRHVSNMYLHITSKCVDQSNKQMWIKIVKPLGFELRKKNWESKQKKCEYTNNT